MILIPDDRSFAGHIRHFTEGCFNLRYLVSIETERLVISLT